VSLELWHRAFLDRAGAPSTVSERIPLTVGI
jgi:hypothetical protein